MIHELGALRRVSTEAVRMDEVEAALTEVVDGVEFRLWQEEGGTVLLPRNFSVPWRGEAPPVRLRTGRRMGDGTFSFRGTLRGVQLDAVKALCLPGDKIISLGCGQGKTVIALYALSICKAFPALVVVPTTALQEQWEERIAEFLTIPKELVGRGAPADMLGKPINVVVMNTAAMRDYAEYASRIFRRFRVVVFDEAHRFAAPLMRAAVERYEGERWGLSATPSRDDGAEVLTRGHLGPLRFSHQETAYTPSFTWVKTGYVGDERQYIHHRTRRLNTAKLYNDMSYDPDRADLLLSEVRKAVSSGRKVLVVGEREASLSYYHQNYGALGSVLFTGSKVPKERAEAAKGADVVFAMSALVKEGFDKPELDTVFLTLPVGGEGRFQQTCGRILRAHAGKKHPLVVAFRDDVWSGTDNFGRKKPGFVQALYAKMARFANAAGYKVTGA